MSTGHPQQNEVADSVGTASLSAPYTTAFDFERTVGPRIGTFLGGLRERRLLGVRASEGRVLCPVAEFDPITAEATGEYVELDPVGTVTACTWTPSTSGASAWALVRIDGADNAFFHRVDHPRPEVGMRVRARWAAEPVGTVEDIVCFEVIA